VALSKRLGGAELRLYVYDIKDNCVW